MPFEQNHQATDPCITVAEGNTFSSLKLQLLHLYVCMDQTTHKTRVRLPENKGIRSHFLFCY